MPIRKYRPRRKAFRKKKVGKNVKKYVKSAIHAQIENKIFDQIYSQITGYDGITTTWKETNLFYPVIGNNYNFRLGNKVSVLGFSINLELVGQTGYPAEVRAVLTLIHGATAPMSNAATAVGLDTLYSKTINSDGLLSRKFMDRKIRLDDTQNRKYVTLKIQRRFKRPLVINFGSVAATGADKCFFLSLLSDKGTNVPYIASGRYHFAYEDA